MAEETVTKTDEEIAAEAEAKAAAETKAAEEAEAAKAEAEKARQSEWDQMRQYKDELAAANKRESETKEQLAQYQADLEEIRAQMETAKKAEGTEGEITDWDSLVDAFKKQQGAVGELQTLLKQQQTESQKREREHTQKVVALEAREREREGKKALSDECAVHEKRLGTKALTNEVVAQVTKEYEELDIVSMPHGPRKVWIQKALKLAYNEAHAAAEANKSSAKGKESDSVLDTGSGGHILGDDFDKAVPEGDSRQVKAAYLKYMSSHPNG
jgi:chromosome segregation ATPase